MFTMLVAPSILTVVPLETEVGAEKAGALLPVGTVPGCAIGVFGAGVRKKNHQQPPANSNKNPRTKTMGGGPLF
jgi:hypothetical protein